MFVRITRASDSCRGSYTFCVDNFEFTKAWLMELVEGSRTRCAEHTVARVISPTKTSNIHESHFKEGVSFTSSRMLYAIFSFLNFFQDCHFVSIGMIALGFSECP